MLQRMIEKINVIEIFLLIVHFSYTVSVHRKKTKKKYPQSK